MSLKKFFENLGDCANLMPLKYLIGLSVVSSFEKVSIIILAAGKGSRMQSNKPKVMHKIGGRFLLDWILNTAQSIADPPQIGLVLSPGMDDVSAYCRKHFPLISLFYQNQQNGTAHAVLAARTFIENAKGPVLILLGDVPFIQPETLTNLLKTLQKNAAAIIAFHADPPNSYGRLIMDQHNQLNKIVEVKDASLLEQQSSLCHSGFFAVQPQFLLPYLQQIKPSPVTHELYLTELVTIVRQHQQTVGVVTADATTVQGVNTQHDLAHAEFYFQQQKRFQALESGVTLIDPLSVYFSFDTHIAPGVTIYPHVVLGPGVQIEQGADIFSFSHIEGAHIKTNAKIGPFARIRPHTIVESQAKIGNFVEIKNATIGTGSKMGHLSYIGDCTMGAHCNIGAGTITVNYDGINKWPTYIGNHAFIGSNTALIAPLTIGDAAMVAAGSCITRDVAKNSIAFGRARQVELANKADEFRRKSQQIKNKG